MLQFAIALPWWALVLVVVAVVAVAAALYFRPLVPLTRPQQVILTALRALTLLFLVACLLRPVRVMPPNAGSDAVVPVLVDVSRSMRLADAGGRPRIDAARELAQQQIASALQGRYQSELWTFGDTLARPQNERFAAEARGSDLSSALRAVR